WLSAPNRITARADCALNADGASRTACLIRLAVSFWLIGKVLPRAYCERRFLKRAMAWLFMVDTLESRTGTIAGPCLWVAILFASKFETIRTEDINCFGFETNVPSPYPCRAFTPCVFA